MIDKKLYCETFSRLHASEEAKKEVFQMTKKKGARIPKLLRGAAIAAAMTMALAVTAGAVNIATDGEFFRQFTIVWTGEDSMRAVDAEGNEVYITTASEDGTVTREDGRLILHANGEKIDITDAIAAEGSYHHEYDMTVVHEDGSEELRTVSIDVAGDLDRWTVTQDQGDGTTITIHSDGSETTGTMNVASESGEELTRYEKKSAVTESTDH